MKPARRLAILAAAASAGIAAVALLGPVAARQFTFGFGKATIASASFVASGKETATLVLYEEDRLESLTMTKPLDGFNWIVFSKEAKVSVLVPFRVSYAVDLEAAKCSYDPFSDELDISVPPPAPLPPSIFTDKVVSQIVKKSALIDEDAAVSELKDGLYPILAAKAAEWAKEARIVSSCKQSLERIAAETVRKALGSAPRRVVVTFAERTQARP